MKSIYMSKKAANKIRRNNLITLSYYEMMKLKSNLKIKTLSKNTKVIISISIEK